MNTYEALFEQYSRYGWSMKMDVYRTSEHPEIQKAVELVWASIPARDRQDKTEQKMRECLKMLLCNLLVAYKSGKCLAIPRKSEAFSKPNRLGKLFIPRTAFLEVVDGMFVNNWIGMQSGYKSDDKEGRLSRIWARSELQALWGELSEDDTSTEASESVIFDDCIYRETGYPADDEFYLRGLTQKIEFINSVYEQNYFAYNEVAEKRFYNPYWFFPDSRNQEVRPFLDIQSNTAPLVDIFRQYIKDPNNIQHHSILYHYGNKMEFEVDSEAMPRRLFPRLAAIYCRGGFTCGGRLYGKPERGVSWQSLSQDARHTITIAKEPTVELDYKGLHISMLYALKGIQMRGDPYSELDGDKMMRPILKKLLLTAINAKSETDTINSMKQEVWELQQSPILKERDLKFLTAVMVSNPDWKSLIQRLKEVHAPLRDFFCSDTGVKLQFLDARIILDVVMYFARQGIPCLPIHDSAIISKYHEKELWDVMDTAYRANMDKFCCGIEKKE